jgi:hypothetical protein
MEKYYVQKGLEIEFNLPTPEFFLKIWRCDLTNKNLILVDEDRVTINKKRLLEYSIKNEVLLTFKIAETQAASHFQ